MTKMDPWFLLLVLFPLASSHGILSPEQFLKTAYFIKSSDDFFNNFVRFNGSRVNITSLHTDQGGSDDRLLVGGEDAEMAEYDACNPRPATQMLGSDNSDPLVLYWPPCTRTMKCGGCCTNSMMKCVPVRVKSKAVQAAKTRLPSPGSPFFEFVSMENVLVEEHLSCEPRCSVHPSDCNRMQEYSDLDCKCICRNYGYVDCGPDHYFDDNTCACRCRREEICFGKHTIFDEDFCACRVMTVHEINEVVLAGGLTRDQVAEIMNSIPSETSPTSPSTTTTTNPSTTTTTTPSTTTPPPTTTSTTTPTTTTTTATSTTTPPRLTTQSGPCPNTKCVLPWKAKQLSSGRCQCMLDFRLPGLPRIHGFGGLRYRKRRKVPRH